MARPARTLEQHIRQGSFRARRHHQLLAGQALPAEWRVFAGLQARYRSATSDPERAAIGLQFEHAVVDVHAQAEARQGALSGPTLDQQLNALGKPGSLTQLLEFYPALLRYPSGPLQGQPFQLEPWQRSFLREFHRRDDAGGRIYKKALLGLPTGNGKTTLAVGLGLYQALSQPAAAEVVLAAGSREQARLGLDCARRMSDLGQLSEWITSTSNRLDYPKKQASMLALSSQGNLQHGRAPAAALLDELWTFSHKRQEQSYTALTAAIHKQPAAFLLATSSAGDNPASLLGRIYHDALSWDDVSVRHHNCLTIAKNPDAGALLWWYAAPADADPSDPKILRACNPASWINLSDLQQQLHDPGLSESDFRRLHLNQWPARGRRPRPLRRAHLRPKSVSGQHDHGLTFEEVLAQIRTGPSPTSGVDGAKPAEWITGGAA